MLVRPQRAPGAGRTEGKRAAKGHLRVDLEGWVAHAAQTDAKPPSAIRMLTADRSRAKPPRQAMRSTSSSHHQQRGLRCSEPTPLISGTWILPCADLRKIYPQLGRIGNGPPSVSAHAPYPPAHGRTNRPRGGKIASALPEEPIARSGVVCVMEEVQHPVPDGVPQSQAVLVRELEVNTSVNAAATCLIGGLG